MDPDPNLRDRNFRIFSAIILFAVEGNILSRPAAPTLARGLRRSASCVRRTSTARINIDLKSRPSERRRGYTRRI